MGRAFVIETNYRKLQFMATIRALTLGEAKYFFAATCNLLSDGVRLTHLRAIKKLLDVDQPTFNS